MTDPTLPHDLNGQWADARSHDLADHRALWRVLDGCARLEISGLPRPARTRDA